MVNALELQIPANEARRALKSPENLDAWSAYHLGLHHLYQFDREANGRAIALFEQAIAKEPGFARAYADWFAASPCGEWRAGTRPPARRRPASTALRR